MSLQIWLPLAGDIKNYGKTFTNFSNLNTTNTYADVNGKLTGCFRNNSNTAGGLISDKQISLGQKQSMFCWFKFSSLTSGSNLGGTLVSQHRYTNNTGLGITIKYVSSTTGYLSVNTGNGSSRTFNTYCGTSLLYSDTWYHGGFTYDNGQLKIYVNGVCEYNNNIGVQSVPADYIMAFCWSLTGSSGTGVHGDYKLNGWLNDVRVYDEVLSDKEVAVLAGGVYGGQSSGYFNGQGPQIWLPLNHDTHNQGIHRTDITSTNISSNDSGRLGLCYYFPGSTNNGISGTFPSNGTDISFCVWALFSTTPAGVHLLDCRDNSGNGYQPMYITSDYIQIGNSFSSFPSIAYGSKFTAGWWYHIAVCYTSSYTKVYINGNEVVTDTSSVGHAFGELPFYLGCRYSGSNPFKGRINDFRIYDRELSGDEIRNIYKCLLLHYPLNNKGHGKDNLVRGGDLYAQGQVEFKSYNAGVLETSDNEQVAISFDLKERINTAGSGYLNVYNTNYQGPHQINNFNALNGRTLTVGDDIRERISGTSTMTTRSSPSKTTDYIEFYSDYSTENEIEVSNIKLERGSVATPYCVHENIPIHYDKEVYSEPDGSKWLHIAHHNNPASSGVFTSSDTFSTGVYKDANRWYDVEQALSDISSGVTELMVKQKTTSDATEVKYRWVQKVSPLTATWEDVQPSAVTRIITSDYTNGGNGGMWKQNSSCRMVIANATSGNWFGAIGSWSTYNGGIPGYPNTVVTTGYIDLYVRIPDHLVEITDVSGFGNHGYMIMYPMEYSTDSKFYPVSTYFNGTTDGIIIENLVLTSLINNSTDGNVGITYSFWIKPESENGARSVYFGSYSGNSWSIEKTASNLLRSYWNGSPDETCTGATITDGSWQHVAVVKDYTSCIRVYINGDLKWVSSLTHGGVTMPTTYRIGRDVRTNDGTPYKGLMSDFRIYGTALSSNDIKDIYNNKL